MTTRDAVSVVGTANHEDFFEPWSCTNMYQLRTFEPRHTTPHHTTHLAVDGPKTTSKSEKKSTPALEFFSSNKSCRYTKPVQTFYIYLRFYPLHPSKAHGICSVKMAGYLGKKILKYLQLF
jgi:hypothetical protein